MKKNKFGLFLSAIILTGALAACGSDDVEKGQALSEDKLLIGVTAGPHEQIMEVVEEVAAEKGLDIELKVFSDYILPNTSLDEGSIDANSYQHSPFLVQFNEDKGTNLVSVGATYISPMGFYSDKFDSFDDVPDGATIGIPNDPTNSTRALYILEDAGYIKINEENHAKATIHDLDENPKNLKFIELEAAQIPKQLPEVDAAAINTNYALDAGINPSEEALLIEAIDSPYANHLVVRAENKDDAVVKTLIESYHSEKVRKFIEEEFGGSIIPTW
ncbi:MetQ/NlpA family ABC transporter substrate-binding protein [Lysinibacillus contaminans]|uniref:MetQ/NlpA family ABC transporter substrate-binding protein n=1 Tax=Lysinibacillus contaminans TaxID=1293441 RepID=UPI0009E98522|nr:MetQ/NlpA family ABC transporter substrate-binding protein [Lysinibacillus contaminans]